MMARKYDYTIVDELPPRALKMSSYATDRGCTVNYLYELAKFVREGKITESKAGFRIINFQSINFIEVI